MTLRLSLTPRLLSGALLFFALSTPGLHALAQPAQNTQTTENSKRVPSSSTEAPPESANSTAPPLRSAKPPAGVAVMKALIPLTGLLIGLGFLFLVGKVIERVVKRRS